MSLINSKENTVSKMPNRRFNKSRISNKLISKFRSISSAERTKFHSFYGNRKCKSDLLITQVLSFSKSLLINEDDKEESKIPDNVIYRYPYKPNYFHNLDSNKNKEKLILKRKINSFQQNSLNISNTRYSNFSNGNSTSAFKPSIDNNNSILNNLLCSSSNRKISEKHFQKKIGSTKNQRNIMMNKTTSSFYSTNNSYYIKERKKEIINSVNINKESFLKVIDNINADNNYINKCKGKLRQYYSGNNKFNIDSSGFKELR